jgi:hypothetical protein
MLCDAPYEQSTKKANTNVTNGHERLMHLVSKDNVLDELTH